MIGSGRVSVSGHTCDDPCADFEPEGFAFSVDGVSWKFRQYAYIALHKPANYECSHKPRFHPSVYTLLPRPLVTRGVQAVGRLDEDTTGLLLMSDDGQFIHKCTSKHDIDDAQVAALLDGIVLNDDPSPIAAAACERISARLLRLTVTEGKYHQVKRMVAAASNRVEALHRVSIGAYVLPATLKPGEWTWLTEEDLALAQASSSAA